MNTMADGEREKFESWARDTYTINRESDGQYCNVHTEDAWHAWQAAIVAQPSPDGQGDARATQVMVDAGAAALLAYRKSGGDYTVHPTHAAEAAINAALAARQPVASNQPAGNSGQLGVDGQAVGQEPVCTECGTPVLFECTGCSRSNYPPYMQGPIGEIVYSGEGGLQIEFYDGKPLAPMKLYAAPPAQAVDHQAALLAEERAHGETIDQRDRYHEVADDLAGHVARITSVGIGEHSSANCPWQNAIEAAEAYQPAQAVDLGQLPDGWRLSKKATCYQLSHGNDIVGNLVGPDAEENAAIIARVLDSKAVGNGR